MNVEYILQCQQKITLPETNYMGTIRSVFSQINWVRFFNIFRPGIIGNNTYDIYILRLL